MFKQNKKKLAVLLPTYNAASYLKESIDSVMNQTFTDFDLYIYDDCSLDDSEELIKSYNNPNIFYIKNEQNIGVTKTLNIGLAFLLPQYEYIARMDADDWCYPKRFEKQLQVLDNNSDVVLCGTQGYWLKDIQQNPANGWTYPVESSYIKYYLLFGATFGHSSVIFKSKTFIEHNLRYDESKINCQDWELWTRVSEVGKLVNVPDFLMKYRIVENSNHRSPEKQKIQFENRSKIIATYWSEFGVSFSEADIFEIYYASKESTHENFIAKSQKLIESFNVVFEQSKMQLSLNDQSNFSYMLARRLLSFWKRSGISRKNLFIWFIIIKKVRFMSKIKLVKSIIR
jgi:glycosyltransferase involved in cell wall biosynthesis